MKKKFFFSIFFLLLLFPFKTFAQTESVYIEDFKSNIVVNQDGTVDITESITYVFNESRHGMYRNIPISYELEAGGIQYLDIDLVNVQYSSLNSDSIYTAYTTSTDSENFSVKIGDADRYIQGKYVYTISYKIKYLIENYSNFDKLYLNVLGDSWDDPIYNTTANITMPTDIQESFCYTGAKGSTESECNIVEIEPNQIQITSSKVFRAGSFLTVTSTVAPGTIQNLTEEKKTFNETFGESIEKQDGTTKFMEIFSAAFAVLIILIVVGILFTVLKTSSNLGSSVIKKYAPNTIPQYNIPQGWYILKTAGFLKNVSPSHTITAQIIQLCVYGYLKIRKTEDTLFIEKTSKSIDTLNTELKDFYQGLMQEKESVEIKKHSNYFKNLSDPDLQIYSGIFRNSINLISIKIFSNLKSEGYFSFKKPGLKGVGAFMILFISMFILIGGGGLLSTLTGNPIFIFIGIPSAMFSFMIYIVIKSIVGSMKTQDQYSEKGKEIERQIHGLHMYMKTAEQNRIEFHNNPDNYKGVFESLLPYAILFGMEKKWAKLFNLASLPWLTSEDGGADFDIGLISSSISSFASQNIMSYSSGGSGDSGGSSGSSGGSSGGGGGGGGGGSW